VSIRSIALLAALGLAPIVVAITIAAADVSRGNLTTVTSTAAVYAGQNNGREAVIALVPVGELARLRAGQSAEVYVANLNVRLPGGVTAVASGDGKLVAGVDPAWVASRMPELGPDLAPIVVTLDFIDPRLTSGSTVGVRIAVSGG